MIQTIQDFVEASEYECSVLASVYPLVNSQRQPRGQDLRTDRLTVVTIGINQEAEKARNELIQKLRPLLFGAAWKVLDLLVEYGLNKKRLAEEKQPKARLTINYKKQNVGHAVVVPLSDDGEVWSRVSALYENTVEIRHCLNHRRFDGSAVDGTLSDFVDEDNSPLALPPLTADEQSAFGRVAQLAFIIMEKECFTQRDRLSIVAALDQITNHHDLGDIGGGAAERAPELIRVNAHQEPAGWIVDIAAAWAWATKHFQGREYFDIEVNFPDTGLAPLMGRLEAAPRDSAVLIDPANPPVWIDL